MATESTDVEFDFARALDRVDVEEDSGVGGDLADFLYGLQDACLIVRQHDADQAGLGPDGAQNVRRVDEAAWLRGDKCCLHAAMREALGSFQNSGGLNLRGNVGVRAEQRRAGTE